MEETNTNIPLGKIFSDLAKAYAGAFTERLSHLPIDRYYYALVVIESYNGDLNQTVLADELLIDKASVVRMLDYLEAENCIVRKRNPQDRRAHILELTPKALEMLPEIKAAVRETNARCLEQANAGGIENVEAVLSKIQHCLHSETENKFKIQIVRSEEKN
ncbi:MAG: MarR family winged helix-turn-helix transcriptional regulator [Saprospiraceae bacterium]|nr:winged helix-turn-helix transcriptional regulator [Lewinellaceae bacterium]